MLEEILTPEEIEMYVKLDNKIAVAMAKEPHRAYEVLIDIERYARPKKYEIDEEAKEDRESDR